MHSKISTTEKKSPAAKLAEEQFSSRPNSPVASFPTLSEIKNGNIYFFSHKIPSKLSRNSRRKAKGCCSILFPKAISESNYNIRIAA